MTIGLLAPQPGIGHAESRADVSALLAQVKAREAVLATEVNSMRFRVTETKEELDSEGKVEEVEKEIRITTPGADTNPAQRQLQKAKVKNEGEGAFSILASSDLFEWEMRPEENLEGSPCKVLSFRPKEGVKPQNQREKVMGQMAGTYWVDAVDLCCRQIVGKLTRLVSVFGFFAEVRELDFLWKGQKVPQRVVTPQKVEYRYRAAVFPFFDTHEKHVLTYEVLP